MQKIRRAKMAILLLTIIVDILPYFYLTYDCNYKNILFFTFFLIAYILSLKLQNKCLNFW